VLTESKSDRNVATVQVSCLLAATVAAFWPLFDNQFVSWDDPYTLTGNDRLAWPGVVRWAFTTTLMGHYQPLSWLTWSAVKSIFGANPVAFHAVSLLGHQLNTVLVYLLAVRLGACSRLEPQSRRVVALTAATVFALHPMRVEVVAWASAFPYILSLGWLLVSAIAYLRYCDNMIPGARRAWFRVAIGSYAISLLSRATAIGFPLVLLVLDVWPLGRARLSPRAVRSHRGAIVGWATVIIEKVPFVLAAGAAAFVESRSREISPLAEISIGARVTMAVTAPLRYLGRTLWPVDRSPVDPLPIAPHVEWSALAFGLVVLAVITLMCWRWRRRWRAPLASWTAYLVLLAPVAGLTPSGQTGTADRYMYVPGVVLSLVVGAICQMGLMRGFRRTPALVMLALAASLGGATWRQTGWWRDSITLWTRAADFDPRNDIATFNLAVAFQEAGRMEEAIGRYEQTLALIPDHQPARRALTSVRAEQGIALTKSGRFEEAATNLRAAFDARPEDLALANALAFTLAQTGRSGEAVSVLKLALARHPDNDEVAHNLARLLATAQDETVRNGALALRLALAVRERTGGKDPRVLDTLAAAYAVSGDLSRARTTVAEAIALARQLGLNDLAEDISTHARSYQR
jgi:tetratricopeptide (TPR) repeat protein